MTEQITAGILTSEPQLTRITRIQIQRLHNLGNYESIRYEVSVDVGEKDDAGKVLATLETALNDIRAKSDCSEYSYNEALKVISNPLNQWGEPHTEEDITYAKNKIAEWEKAQAKREAARELLSSLSCVEKHRDAKENWEDWEDEEYG